MIDHQILNDLIEADNKAQDEAIQKSKEKAEYPGIDRYDSVDDYWDEVELAEKEQSQNKNMEVQ